MDILKMMDELARDGVECNLQVIRPRPAINPRLWEQKLGRPWSEIQGRPIWWAAIGDVTTPWWCRPGSAAHYGLTPEEAWRKACGAWDQMMAANKELYREATLSQAGAEEQSSAAADESRRRYLSQGDMLKMNAPFPPELGYDDCPPTGNDGGGSITA